MAHMRLSESALARLETQLDSLSLVMAGASPQAIERRPSPEKWSARENLAHLARYQEVFSERMTCILNDDNPLLARYRAEEDPQWPAWVNLPTSELLERLKRLRQELCARVKKLSPKQLERTGVHSKFGEMTLALWIEFFLLHEAHHLYVALQRLRENE